MPYAGKTIPPRIIIALCYAQGWRWLNLAKMGATILGESKGSIGAWHDNLRLITDLNAGQVVCNVETYEPTTILDPATGKVRLSDGSTVTVPLTTLWIISRDCGLGENSIDAVRIGTASEFELRTESFDPAVYMTVARRNVEVCWQKFHEPWPRAAKPKIRCFQPWYAWTTGWGPFKEWWVWARDADGQPLNRWDPTGRYIHQAVRGVANFHLIEAGDYTPEQALAIAEERAAQFGILPAPGEDHCFVLGEMADGRPIVNWWKLPPPKPTAPPADGIGPRPVENDGAC